MQGGMATDNTVNASDRSAGFQPAPCDAGVGEKERERAGSPRSETKARPLQQRAVETRERLLDMAGELLAEVGVERISTNLISARAGMTPPALYRYFSDKYAVLEALGRRLMDRQNAVLFAWLDRYAPSGLEAIGQATEELLRTTADVTASEPGAIWTLRALRAVPQLAHVRIESHRLVTDRMVEAYQPLLPDMPREVLWRRVRISVEFGFAADEMLNEETLIPRDDLLRDAALLLRHALTP
jgi:AcrR family transcriptional regulator